MQARKVRTCGFGERQRDYKALKPLETTLLCLGNASTLVLKVEKEKLPSSSCYVLSFILFDQLKFFSYCFRSICSEFRCCYDAISDMHKC